MEIHQRCCGITLRRRGTKVKLEQNKNVFLKVIKHNRYQQNTLKIFIITRLLLNKGELCISHKRYDYSLFYITYNDVVSQQIQGGGQHYHILSHLQEY